MKIDRRTSDALTGVNWRAIALETKERGNWAYSTLAKKLGTNPTTVARIAQGYTKEPRIRTAVRLLNLHHEVTQ